MYEPVPLDKITDKRLWVRESPLWSLSESCLNLKRCSGRDSKSTVPDSWLPFYRTLEEEKGKWDLAHRSRLIISKIMVKKRRGLAHRSRLIISKITVKKRRGQKQRHKGRQQQTSSAHSTSSPCSCWLLCQECALSLFPACLPPNLQLYKSCFLHKTSPISADQLNLPFPHYSIFIHSVAWKSP